jgi:hypothetical protein
MLTITRMTAVIGRLRVAIVHALVHKGVGVVGGAARVDAEVHIWQKIAEAGGHNCLTI